MQPTRVAAALLAASALLATVPAGAEEAHDAHVTFCALTTRSRYEATTRSCLGCHDGSVAASVDGGHSIRSNGALGPSHPVDVVYEQAAERRGGSYRPLTALSRRYWLPGGRVTCTTCHDGASSEPKHVSVTMSRSALCAGCHVI